jgi:hypothetical protein
MFVLRSTVLDLMRHMATAGFCPEPLQGSPDSKTLDATLLDVQKSFEGLNSVWREQARMRVKPALEETNKRYFARLCGSLRFVDSETPKEIIKDKGQTTPEALKRKYFHIPESVQDVITKDDIAALKALGEQGDPIALFRDLVINQDTGAMSAAQVSVLIDIHARALRKHTVPEFGAKEDFTLQLHIDARMVPEKQKAEAIEVRNGVSFLLADDKNTLYHRFLDISGVGAREERIRLPLVLSRKVAQRIQSTNKQWASLILEISEHSFGVRLVAGKPQDELPTSVKAFVGRDFGYANTISLSVAMLEASVNLSGVRTDLDRLDSKVSVQKLLEKCEMRQDPVIVERVRFEGRGFLKGINGLCERIDGYKSKIDLAYNALNALRASIARDLLLDAEQLITPEMKRQNADVQAFFALFGKIQDLKKARRALYRKITAIKKAWFGFLSNVEITLAQKYNAAVVREDLTVEAVEKEAPDYKGRLFNKMINNGSKGQYQKRATDKFQWNGIPEIVVPSWYTSRTCLKHSRIVDKKHRKGERIYLPCCDQHHHADEHASDTIATYPLLKPLLTSDATAKAKAPGVCDTSYPLSGKHRPLGR